MSPAQLRERKLAAAPPRCGEPLPEAHPIERRGRRPEDRPPRRSPLSGPRSGREECWSAGGGSGAPLAARFVHPCHQRRLTSTNANAAKATTTRWIARVSRIGIRGNTSPRARRGRTACYPTKVRCPGATVATCTSPGVKAPMRFRCRPRRRFFSGKTGMVMEHSNVS